MALKRGTPVVVAYDTRFLINWPEHLGGANVYMDLVGTMVLTPSMSL
jgi:hypothetical protein